MASHALPWFGQQIRHYSDRWDKFLVLCGNVEKHGGNILELTGDTPVQAALLKDLE